VKYLLAFICPPAALLYIGKPNQALLNLVLTLLLYFPGVLHALFVIVSDDADERTTRIVNAMKPPTAAWVPNFSQTNGKRSPVKGPSKAVSMKLSSAHKTDQK
jgi:uncharacterized membrane protein YqaE (UPF0057 family)